MLQYLSLLILLAPVSVTEDQQKELVSDWWNWVVFYNRTGIEPNVLQDKTGDIIMKYQPDIDNVYFLTGAPNSTAVRNVTIPANDIILAPVLDTMVSCETCNILDLPTLKDRLIEAARINPVGVVYLEARLNGELIPYYRITSDIFELALPDDQLRTYPALTDGYWVLLKLDKGEHVLYTKGIDRHGYHTEVTYNIKIK